MAAAPHPPPASLNPAQLAAVLSQIVPHFPPKKMKPNHVEEAVEALQQLSGRAHRVLTGVCLITPDDRMRFKLVDTRVRFKRLSAAEIEAYVASREWHGKAGGYAIQGLAGCFAQKIIGSYTNVVGLPLAEVTAMLIGENFPVHYNWVKAADADPA